jgi:glycerophosphoryl diester phosphodiesterase
MDTRLSKDGIVMVIHDPTLERTTDGAGRVSDKTMAELQSLNAAAQFQDGKFERQPVPTFAQALELLKGNAVRVEVEIKVPPWGRYLGIEEKLVKEVVDRDLVERVQVSSFDFDVLKDVKRINPKIKTVALLTVDFFRRMPPDQPAKVIDAVQAVGADLIAVNKDLLTSAIVQAAHQRGLKVEVWTVDAEAEMQKFIQIGVDGIISNQPDVLKRVTSGK